MTEASDDIEEDSRRLARIAGGLYLVVTVAALFGEVVVRGKLLRLGDPAVTATNILSHQSLYRLGAAADLIAFMADAALAVVLLGLFEHASRLLSLAMAVFRLGHAVIAAANTLNYLAPLVLLAGTGAVASAGAASDADLAILFLRMHANGYNVALMFFGVHCVLLGVLIGRSGLIPKVLGALIGVAGACYLANSIAAFVAPTLKAAIYPAVLIPAGLAEWALMLWLLLGRVKVSGLALASRAA